MELNQYFKSLIDVDNTPIVICDLNHTIIYMNKTAIESYKKRGNIIGKNIFLCHNEQSQKKITEVIEWFKKDVNNNIVHTFRNEEKKKDVYMIALRDDSDNLIGYYEKHEYRNIDNSPFYDLK